MAIKLSPRQIIKYVPESERSLPEAEQTVFEIAPLTVAQESEVKDALYVNGSPAPYRQYEKAFSAGVVNVINLVDEDGKPVAYKNDSAIIEKIPRWIRDEVGLAVLRTLERSKDETKN